MHNLCCDNCHSHVARALNLMQYDGSTRFNSYLPYEKILYSPNIFILSWNMVTLCALMLVHGKHVSWWAVLRTWLPSLVLLGIVATIVLLSHPTLAPM